MAPIPQTELKRVKKWYQGHRQSAREIAQRLDVTMWSVYSFFRRHGIPRRSHKENNRIQFERKKPSFHLKRRLSRNERELLLAAVMLYWAEGSKFADAYGVDFANSDPEMVRLFVLFLRKICRVDKKRMRCALYCYANQSLGELHRYWSRLTNIPLSQFTKPYVRTDFDPRKKGKMPYGLIHIRYSDKKLLNLFRQWIAQIPFEIYNANMRAGTQVANGG